jgi:hypothetical protein
VKAKQLAKVNAVYRAIVDRHMRRRPKPTTVRVK